MSPSKEKVAGHQRLRQPSASQVLDEVRALRKAGKTLPEITNELRLAKGHSIKYLYGRTGKRLLRKFCDETTVDCILVISEGLELLRNEFTQLKVRSYLDESHLSPPDLGSVLRSIQKTFDIYNAIQKKGTQGLSPVPDEREDPRLIEAKRLAQELEKDWPLDGRAKAEDNDPLTELNSDEP